jgi:hypothetical protein
VVALQFLEVAVGYVVATPVWDCVELDAVGEFHFLLFGKPLELAEPLVTSLGIPAWGRVVGGWIPRGFRKVLKLERGFSAVCSTQTQTQNINNVMRGGSVLAQPSGVTMVLW